MIIGKVERGLRVYFCSALFVCRNFFLLLLG